ncbi:M48 family metallopeptidase [Thalassospira alkalitolerans]|uniref:M48 family metallopeptidase n=1 Tax=Thalassospira alkalitolerans TaxID=1293890 RepID=UPI003AA9338D
MTNLLNARLFDGKTSAARDVTVEIFDRYIAVYHSDGKETNLSLTEILLCEKPNPGKPLRLRNKTDNGLRLVFDDNAAKQAVTNALPSLSVAEGSTHARFGLTLGITGFSILVVLLIWLGLPVVVDMLVAIYPKSQEIELGRSVREQVVALFGEDDGDTGKLTCAPGDRGQKAIDAIFDRFKATGALSYHYETTIIRSDIENALSLPGGQVLVFSGLLKNMNSPDALAGVMAHEIGHNEKHHSLNKLFSGAALSQLARLITGGAQVPVGFLLEQSYSRGMETEADQFAINLMRAASINTNDTAALFKRLSSESRYAKYSKILPEIFSSHPEMEHRIAQFGNANITGNLDIAAANWRALRNACDDEGPD